MSIPPEAESKKKTTVGKQEFNSCSQESEYLRGSKFKIGKTSPTVKKLTFEIKSKEV